MKDKLKSGTAAWRKRQAVWRHNSFFGGVGMARQNMRAIVDSHTATLVAKHTAQIILHHLGDLNDQLKERVDAN